MADADTLGSPARPRPDAAPSSTVGTTTTMMLALAATGLFLGSWVHNAGPAGDDWIALALECTASGTDVGRTSAQGCMMPAWRTHAAYSVGGLLVLLAGFLGWSFLVPLIALRRRGDPAAEERFRAALERVRTLAQEGGLRRAPTVEVGDARQRHAFVTGPPWNARLVLPRKLVLSARTGMPFDPVVRHELVHVRRHDAAAARIAESWSVVAVLVAAPILWGLTTRETSLLPVYWWRALIVVLAAFLAARALLRAREHDADLLSAPTAESRHALRTFLGTGARATDEGSEPTWWSRARALHPTAAERVAVLDDPGRGARVRAVAVGTPAFFVVMTMEGVQLLAGALSDSAVAHYLVPGILLGIVLGTTTGVLVWRGAVLGRVAGVAVPGLPGAVGTVVGAFSGGLVSLGGVGDATLTSSWGSLLLRAVWMAGAFALSVGFAELVADAVPRLTRNAGWVACALFSSAVYAVALWATGPAGLVVDSFGWPAAAALVRELVASDGLAVTWFVLAAAVAGMVGRRRRGELRAPSWAVEGGTAPWPVRHRSGVRRLVVVGACCGAAASLCIVVFRLVAGPAPAADGLQRLGSYAWVIALAGLVTALSAAAGRVEGLFAGAVATAVAALGFGVLNTALGGRPDPLFFWDATSPAFALALALLPVVALAVRPVLDVRARRRGADDRAASTTHPGLAAVGAVVLVALTGSAVLAVPDLVVQTVDATAEPGRVGPADSTQDEDYLTRHPLTVDAFLVDAVSLRAEVEAGVAQGRVSLSDAADRLDAFRTDRVEPLHDEIAALPLGSVEASSLRDTELTLLDRSGAALAALAAALRQDDGNAWNAAMSEWDAVVQGWAQWRESVAGR